MNEIKFYTMGNGSPVTLGKAFIIFLLIELCLYSSSIQAQSKDVDMSIFNTDFQSMMSIQKIRSIDYENNVYKVNFDFFLGSIEIRQIAMGKRKISKGNYADVYSYQVYGPILDTTFTYRLLPGDSTLVIKERNGQQVSKVVFGPEFSYDHNFENGAMDFKYYFYNLILSIQGQFTDDQLSRAFHLEFQQSRCFIKPKVNN
jgi:hypothetical protein